MAGAGVRFAAFFLAATPDAGRPQRHLSAASAQPSSLAVMERARGQPSHHDRLGATGPAVEDHGRAVTANWRAAAWYRQAQRAVDRRQAIAALRLAVIADAAFALALADLGSLTGAARNGSGGRPMSWERHHMEVVSTAAAGNPVRALDLLREHIASVGCDPLAVRIVAQLRRPAATADDFEDLADQLSPCHATTWRSVP